MSLKVDEEKIRPEDDFYGWGQSFEFLAMLFG